MGGQTRLTPALRREVKAVAKIHILSQLPLCAAAAGAYIIPMVLLSMVTAVPINASLQYMAAMFAASFFCQACLLGPIMLGMQYFFVDVARGHGSGMAVVFSPLGQVQELLRGIRMTFCLAFRMMLLSLIPSAVYLGAAYLSSIWLERQGIMDNQTVMLVLCLLVAAYLLMMLPVLAYAVSYQLGYAFLRDDPGIGVWQATAQGSRLLRGQRRASLSFLLSFLPWYVGGLFTCGLTTLFGLIYESVALFILKDRLCAAQDMFIPK